MPYPDYGCKSRKSKSLGYEIPYYVKGIIGAYRLR